MSHARTWWLAAWVGLAGLSCGGSSSGECAGDSDCPPGRYCDTQSASCNFDCTFDADCPAGLSCTVRGRCQLDCQPSNGGVEDCDGLDNDCDGRTDEGLAPRACARENGLGRCEGVEECLAGAWTCDAAEPAAEDCNGLDDDCDAETDELLEPRACQRENLHGRCEGVESCLAGAWTCDAAEPAADDCNGLDDDCDGQTDEGLADAPCPLAQGVCATARRSCQGAAGWTACDYGPHHEPLDETSCDLRDNDCDGETDEGVARRAECELSAEASDGLDNDCNGVADEPGGCMIRHPFLPLYVDAYEAVVVERADCTGTIWGQGGWYDYPADWPMQPGPGDRRLYACSLPNVRPSRALTWYQARSACQAQGKRLCTKEEWSQACGGSLYWEYPYGQAFSPDACNTFATAVDDSLPTGAMPGCVSEGGAYDMSGNVWEWIENTCTWDASYKGIQGGSYYCTVRDEQTGNYVPCELDDPAHFDDFRWRYHCGWPMNGWYCDDAGLLFSDVGFRCCWDAP